MRLLVIVVVAVLLVACADPSTPTRVPSPTQTVTPSPVPVIQTPPPVFIPTATVTPIPVPSQPLTDTPPTPVPTPTPDPATATPAPPPDLVIDLASISDSNPRTGQFPTLNATVRNRRGLSNPTTLRYYRSTDSTVTPDDTEVGSDRVSELNSSGSSAESTLTYAPSTPGAYYFGACVDSVSGESDTTNNCSAVLASTVTATETATPTLPSEPSDVEELLLERSSHDGGISAAFLEKPWIRDGLTVAEAYTVGELLTGPFYSESEAESEVLLRIVEMPFLDTFEVSDYAVAECLIRLGFEGYLRQALDHPLLSGGISDTNAWFVLGLLSTFLGADAKNIDNRHRLLDPAQMYLQERTIVLPLAGELTLIVVRLTPDAPRTIDIVEELLHQHESFMNVAYPFNVAAVFILDDGQVAGHNYGNGIMRAHPVHEEDLDILAHELAHDYWFPPFAWGESVPVIDYAPFNWIVEGAATFMQAHAADWLERAPTSPSEIRFNISCTLGTIEEYDRKTFDGTLMDSSAGTCPYTMGLGIFADLYNRLGDAEFRRGFGSLYLKMSSREHDDECVWESRGLCYMRKAFVEDASPGFAEAAGEVIDLWFHGK